MFNTPGRMLTLRPPWDPVVALGIFAIWLRLELSPVGLHLAHELY